MKSRILSAIITIFVVLTTYAGPARPGFHMVTQPDGTTFQAIYRGDEFAKIKTTAEGHAIIMDSEGWWCYAEYDAEGNISNTGYKVGRKTPSAILGASMAIPYSRIFHNAELKRSRAFRTEGTPLLARVMEKQTSCTKSDVVATKHGIVILAAFSDIGFRYTKEDFVKLLTLEDYGLYGATGSAKQYFDDQFHGKIEFDFDVSDIVTLSSRRAYYGGNDSNGNDKRPAEMIAEACILASEAGTDFSLYDDDGDGYVDNVFVFFAGEDEAETGNDEDCIWSHAWYITSGAGLEELTLNGKIIDRYACTAEISMNGEMATIGSFCHEYSHTFGLPDFYDTDYEENGGWAAGLWHTTSLMDAGNYNNLGNTPPYFNCIERELLGLEKPIVIKKNGTYTMKPIHDGGKFYRLDTDNDTEYYLFECRSNDGWDRFIGGSGMLVYHIDKSSPSKWEYTNEVNVNPAHQCADLIEADGRGDDISEGVTGSIGGIFFPSGAAELTPDGSPGLKFWSGQKCEISITGITSRNGEISFSVTGFEGDTPPEPEALKAEAFMDAAIIRFESDRPYAGQAIVEWGRTGQETETIMLSPYEEGKYSLTLEGLTPGNKTYTVTVHFELDGIQGASRTTSFMTSKAAPVSWPYINIGKAPVNMDGSFPKGSEIALRAYNATDAAEIVWYFNEKQISPGGNGYYTVTESGLLKAYVYWDNGSIDILERPINISE